MPDEPAIPADLLVPPDGPPPALPPETALQELPFHGLSWKNFERLTLRLAGSEAEAEESRQYGTPGQNQSGIDVFSRLRGGGYCVYQCKRYDRLYPADIRAAVKRFIDGDWAPRARSLVLCTSHSCVATERAEVIEEQAALLRAREPAMMFQVWDAERLALMLKERPDLVRDFFGRDALRRFDPAAFEAEAGTSVEAALERLVSRTTSATQILDLSDGSEKLRDAYRELRPDGLRQMRAILGESPGAELVAGVIAYPPSSLAGMGAAEWRVVAVEAERTGEWLSASHAWEAVALRADTDDVRIRALGDGAAAAGVAGDMTLKASLHQRARTVNPSHPRVVLMELNEGMSPDAQLAHLEGISSTDSGVQSLIHGHRVIAHLMLADVESAERELSAAKALTPESATVQMLHVNVAVHRGRLDRLAHRPLQGPELRAAVAQAAATRQRLNDQRRHGEAVRLIMLQGDAHLLLEERGRAAQILATASPEELAEPDAGEVLGDAALRVLDFKLALRLTENASESDAIQRIRAAAHLEVGTASEKTAALSMLDRLIAGAGPEASEAAFLRLHAALASGHVAWNDEARDRLVEAGHRREATILEASHLAIRRHDMDSAVALLKETGEPQWSTVWVMRLLLTHSQSNSALKKAAGDVMLTGPSQAIRVECGRAFARAGDHVRAQEVLISGARDPGAPVENRAEAYHYLVRLAGVEQNDWAQAGEHLSDWIALAPGDARASQWAPTVANRKRRT